MSLLPVSEALSRVIGACKVNGTETVALNQALGRVLAEDLPANFTQPAFNASSMDGYAVRYEDLRRKPTALIVIGAAPAGHAFEGTVEQGQAVRIFTGAPLPEGADTVVMQEHTERNGDIVVIQKNPPARGHFVRPKGMDFSSGEVLLRAGRRLGPREIGLAAAMNHAMLPVRRRPVVAVLATGDELVMPGGTPRPDQIIASNSFALEALIRGCGAEVMDLGLAEDNRESLIAAGKNARAADIIVTTGGASVGEHDLVIGAFQELGLKVDFWKVAQRPGKPMIFGHIGDSLFLGLPGNPVSALVCAAVYLQPMIVKMLGLPPQSIFRTAVLNEDLPANDERQDFLRAKLGTSPSGELLVSAFSRQDSAMLNILARADALLIRPPHARAAKAGEQVEIIRLEF
ncbi:MAG: molybdopterin molybdenumtransferase MoeA [Hyphomicrobiales bacterium]|nr:MAG: molybdopterin molybdenumtransferase MoeA [Hyphomicrobiales bacterium]